MATAWEQDVDAFYAQLPRLLEEHSGKFALMRRGDLVDIFDTFEQARTAGYDKFKLEPFLVEHVLPAEERKAHLPFITECRA